MASFGSRSVLRAAVTDTTLPTLGVDTLDIPGTVVDYDTGHSTVPFFVGGAAADRVIPASGAAVTNIAAGRAAALGISGSTNGALTYASQITTAGSTQGKIERLTDGSIHVICSQATPLAANQYASITLADNVAAYLATRPDDKFVVVHWQKVTRAVPASYLTGNGLAFSALSSNWNQGTAVSGLYAMFQTGANNDYPTGASGQRVDEYASDAAQARGYVGAICRILTISGWYGARPPVLPTSTAKNGDQVAMLWGPASPAPSAGAAAASSIFQRFAIHNATASGLTTSDIVAREAARWAREANTAADGTPLTGRFVGTTFTAPSSIP